MYHTGIIQALYEHHTGIIHVLVCRHQVLYWHPTGIIQELYGHYTGIIQEIPNPLALQLARHRPSPRDMSSSPVVPCSFHELQTIAHEDTFDKQTRTRWRCDECGTKHRGRHRTVWPCWPCSKEAIHLEVKILSGEVTPVDMMASALVIDLKNLVSFAVANQSTPSRGVDADITAVDLLHNGELLADNVTLRDAGLSTGDEVVVREGPLSFTVRLLSGQGMPVRMYSSAYINDLKGFVIEWAFNSSSGFRHQRENFGVDLALGSQFLIGEMTLHDAGIASRDEITLIHRLVDSDYYPPPLIESSDDSRQPSVGILSSASESESDASDDAGCIRVMTQSQMMIAPHQQLPWRFDDDR